MTANTTPTFLRRFEVFAPILAGKSAPILESVHITLGFTGPIDKESGMVLNLVEVDHWINEFKMSFTKKSYSSRWDLCQHIQTKFYKLIPRTEFTDIRVEFFDWGVWFVGDETILKWFQRSLIQSKKLIWYSPVTLTLKTQSPKVLPVTKVTSRKINDSLMKIQLDKFNWDFKGFDFQSFEYFDPQLGCFVRI